MEEELEENKEVIEPEDEEEAQFLSFSQAQNQAEDDAEKNATGPKNDLFVDSDYKKDNQTLNRVK